jgi:hypothetical protein
MLVTRLASPILVVARARPMVRTNRPGVGRELELLDLDTRAYGRIPDGQQLRALCEQHLVSKSISDATPGDVLLMRFTTVV